MKSRGKVCIVYDTNIMYKSGDKGLDFSSFSLNSRYSNLVEYIEKNDLIDQVQIIIPKLVVEELKKQQIDKYYEELHKVRNSATQFKGLFDLSSMFMDIDYESYLDEIYNVYIEKLNKMQVETKLIDFPSNNRFSQLITRAINKISPFESKTKQSDKGFKDALLWEALMENDINENVDTLIMYSADSKFTELKDEFQSEKSIEYMVLYTETEIKEILKNKYLLDENDLVERKISYIKSIISSRDIDDYFVNLEYQSGFLINNIINVEIIDIRQIESPEQKVFSFNTEVICNCNLEKELLTINKSLLITLSIDINVDNDDYDVQSLEVKGEK